MQCSWGDCSSPPNGGSNGGGSGNPSPPDPVLALNDFSMDGDDVDDPQTGKPNCASPSTLTIGQKSWCGGSVPTGENLVRVNAAIARMKALGGVCASRADRLTNYIADGRLRFFANNINPLTNARPYPEGGWAPKGAGENGWISLMDTWVTNAYDTSHHATDNRTLQWAMAHEADHTFGLDHLPKVGTAAAATQNSWSCSDLGPI
ncbi:MAG: hypothetical protein ABJB66_20405 [Gemmatimonadaceae bacterium]